MVTVAFAGKPTLAPVAFESATEKVFEPVKGVVLTATLKVLALASPSLHESDPLAAV